MLWYITLILLSCFRVSVAQPPPGCGVPHVFTLEELQRALDGLDQYIPKSKNLKKAGTLNLISTGGYVAVSHFKNRNKTHDIDYMMDPSMKNLSKVRKKLINAIEHVADETGIQKDWANDEVKGFLDAKQGKKLFNESVKQNKVLYEGKNVKIFAASWKWSLIKKLELVAQQRRDADISDAASLLREVVRENGGSISRSDLKSWNNNIYSFIDDRTIDIVDRKYTFRYGESDIRDEETQVNAPPKAEEEKEKAKDKQKKKNKFTHDELK